MVACIPQRCRIWRAAARLRCTLRCVLTQSATGKWFVTGLMVLRPATCVLVTIVPMSLLARSTWVASSTTSLETFRASVQSYTFMIFSVRAGAGNAVLALFSHWRVTLLFAGLNGSRTRPISDYLASQDFFVILPDIYEGSQFEEHGGFAAPGKFSEEVRFCCHFDDPPCTLKLAQMPTPCLPFSHQFCVFIYHFVHCCSCPQVLPCIFQF